MHTTRRGRFWIALGGPKAVRIIYVIVLFYALVIGGLMLGYADVQKCLQDYSDQNAAALRVRTEASADDRILSQRIENVDKADRVRIIANQAALADLVQSAADNNSLAAESALKHFTEVNDASLKIFQKNEQERTMIAEARRAIDAKRAATPLPEAPSEQC